MEKQPDRELGSTEIEAWIPTRQTELGRTLEPFIIHDRASYSVYLAHVLQPVVDRLGSNGFPTACTILQAERDAVIDKHDVVNFFSAVLGL